MGTEILAKLRIIRPRLTFSQGYAEGYAAGQRGRGTCGADRKTQPYWQRR